MFVVSIMCVCVHACTHARACVLFLVQQHTKIHVDLPILCSCNGTLVHCYTPVKVLLALSHSRSIINYNNGNKVNFWGHKMQMII